MMKSSVGAHGAARRANRITLGTLASLLVVILAWPLQGGLTARNFVIAGALAAPLLLPIRGLWRGSRRTHAWATLCVIPYFIVGTVESISNPDTRAWSATALALALVLFTALIVYLRLTRP